MAKKTQSSAGISPRPPVVAVLGHVDHGKTTLLDAIRATNVASREHGGITQSIGATSVGTKEGRTITFIDTPGHEAFSQMRSRGAHSADIAILVVAADDGVKPQTIESIRQIKEAGIPFAVAVNKIDLPTGDVEKVKQGLAKHDVQVEGFGGAVPIISVSAKNKTGIDALLDLIVLMADMTGLENNPEGLLQAHVIETRIDKGKGMTVSLVVKSGTLHSGDVLYEENTKIARVRALISDKGTHVPEVAPGYAAEVLGFDQLPVVGCILSTHASEKQIKMAEESKEIKDSIPNFLKPLEEVENKELNILLKADTAGSLEAVKESLNEHIHIVEHGLGDVSEADVLLAKSTKAAIIGFQVKASNAIAKLASSERVIVRTYTLIYQLLEELSDAAEGMLENEAEKELGKGKIIAEFPFNNLRVAGVKIEEGRFAKGDTVRILRNEEQVYTAKIKSLRHGKDDVNKLEAGKECGIIFDRTVDFSLSDAIIAFRT